MTATRRAATLFRAALAGLVILALVVGVPILLVSTVGNPLPDPWSWNSPLTNTAILGIIACVAWIFWAQFAVCFLIELVAEVRLATGRSASWLNRIPGTFEGQQTLARVLVEAVVAVGISSTVSATPTFWTAHAVAAPVAEPTPPATSAHLETTPAPAPAKARPKPHGFATTTIEVQRGDSLWSIAEARLGAGERWREIAELNDGRVMSDGSTFRDASTILPGWKLLVPVPSPSRGETHEVTVEAGDSLWGLADQAYGNGAEWPGIYQANRSRIDDPNLIYPGQRLVVPGAAPEQPSHTPKLHVDGRPRQANPEPSEQAEPTRPAQQPTATLGVSQSADPTAAPSDAATPTSTEGDGSGDDGANLDGGTLARALVGGGGFLAAGLLAGLLARRRAQSRNRRSGRTIPRTPAPLTATESTVRTTGSAASESARFLDEVLRELAATVRRDHTALPDVRAVAVDDSQLVLQLAGPASQAPPPWTAAPDGTTWTIARDHRPEELADFAPYPTLSAVGADGAGATWFLDLEAAGIVQILGDPSTAADVARFVAAELATNAWSNIVDVTVSGLAAELVPVNPSRLTVDQHLDIDRLTKTARRAREASQVSGLDPLAGRLDRTGADSWMPAVLVADARARVSDELRRQTCELAEELVFHHGRPTVAVVLVTDEPLCDEGLVMTTDRKGVLSTPWGQLRANRISRSEAQELAALFTAVATVDDEPMPPLVAEDGSTSGLDEAGALVEELTEPRCGTGDPDSLLPKPDQRYIAAGATTAEDLAALAPAIPTETAARIRARDPELDADLAEWADDDSRRPKLRLLGPIELRAFGERSDEDERRAPYYAELTAYLACRPEGASPEQVATDFRLQHHSMHSRIRTLRKWLDVNPATGRPHLPESNTTTASRARGMPMYQLEGVLVDIDLFRRLRSRGEASGPAGMDDLRRALDLVAGQPFTNLRKNGYGWLSETPVDHYMSAGIVDVAHLVATHALTEGDPTTAVWAAEKAIAAVPSDDKPRLDLARARAALGDREGAEEYVAREVHNRSDDDDAPPEPTERTSQVLDQVSRRPD